MSDSHRYEEKTILAAVAIAVSKGLKIDSTTAVHAIDLRNRTDHSIAVTTHHHEEQTTLKRIDSEAVAAMSWRHSGTASTTSHHRVQATRFDSLIPITGLGHLSTMTNTRTNLK